MQVDSKSKVNEELWLKGKGRIMMYELATDKLRQMLDEHGVEGSVDDGRHGRGTNWVCKIGRCSFYEDTTNGYTQLDVKNKGQRVLHITSDIQPPEFIIIAEQIIAATLGSDERYNAGSTNDIKGGDSQATNPCPFCGNKADLVEMETKCDGMRFWKVSCNDYRCMGANIHMWYNTESEAIKAGNTRATIGNKKVKAHPGGYEPDTSAFDVTQCECGCLNDVSATYCNDCGGMIKVSMDIEKEV